MKAPLESDLHAWVDGRLDAARADEIAAWLAAHPDDAERVASWRRQKEILHAAFDPVLEEPVPDRLSLRARPRPAMPFRAIAAAVGWLALGAVVGYALRGAPSPGETPPTLARNAAIAHAVYAPDVRHPVEVAADQEAHLVQWLSRRLGTPLSVPRLAEQGFALVGGRLLPGERGPVAQFMYEDGSGRRLTLYVRTDPQQRDTAFRYAREGQVGVFYWIDRKLGYALSGDLTRDELLAVAESAYRQFGAR